MKLWIVSRANTYRYDFTNNLICTYAFKSEEDAMAFVARDFNEKLTWMMGLKEQIVYASSDVKSVEKDPSCTAVVITRGTQDEEECRVTWCVNATNVDETFSTGIKDNEMREEFK